MRLPPPWVCSQAVVMRGWMRCEDWSSFTGVASSLLFLSMSWNEWSRVCSVLNLLEIVGEFDGNEKGTSIFFVPSRFLFFAFVRPRVTTESTSTGSGSPGVAISLALCLPFDFVSLPISPLRFFHLFSSSAKLAEPFSPGSE